ncbi:hypothetical protein [Kordia jejudonensis]|uniref:hypothetical protein n=1 Tax=Kordia jejudonensis TaxID=1348245 RepID=UPI0006291683|nr:hypothetical protein [Kordia jejudonensis]
MEEATRKQTAKKTYSWELVTYEKQGKLFVEWRTNAPFRAQKDRIVVFEKGFPRDAGGHSKAWTWADANKSPWNTDLPFGAEWYVARIAEAAPDGPYVYVEQIITKG